MTNSLIVMVGIQGSGKSTKAKELSALYDAVILSSDEIRTYNPSWDNNKVFEYLYELMNKYLRYNKSVIIDATNTTLKSRRAIFDHLDKIAVEDIIAYVMNTPEVECKARVMNRNNDPNEHYVPLEVVDRYIKNFQIPHDEEGFHEIIYNECSKFDINKCLDLLDETVSFDQLNHHHTMDLYNHSARAGFSYGNLCVGLFHDIGKLFCQTIDDKGEAHYFNHANIGAYYLMSHLEVIPENQRNEVLVITNYHMKVYDWKTEKTHNKYKKLLGDWYYSLIKFHEADEGAH